MIEKLKNKGGLDLRSTSENLKIIKENSEAIVMEYLKKTIQVQAALKLLENRDD